MSNRTKLTDTHNATGSPESEDGRSRCSLQDGRKTGPYGPAPALASLSARQAQEEGLMTKGIFGPHGDGSSINAGLQQSLESRLQARMEGLGCKAYKLTAKRWDMKPLPSIFALRASALHTSGSACGGLPTPSGTSNGGKNHVAGRLDEWGGSSNPFRGTSDGKTHCPAFELWMLGYPDEWRLAMRRVTPSSRKSRRKS